MSEMIIKTAKEAIHAKEPTSRASPLIFRAYQHRCQALHVIVEKALKKMGLSSQLLLLGAGLDTSYERLYADLVGGSFVVDFGSIIEQRDSSNNTTTVIADIRDTVSLNDNLTSSGFDFGKDTVIIVEMVLNYLPSAAVEELLSFLSRAFSIAGGLPILICYDYFKLSENSAFSSVLLQKFRMRGAPLEHVPLNGVSQHDILKKTGWSNACVNSVGLTLSSFRKLNLITNSVFARNAAENETAVFFDEYASLALLDKHYAVTIASMTSFHNDNEGVAEAAATMVACGLYAELGLRPREYRVPRAEPGPHFAGDKFDEDHSVSGISIKRLHKNTPLLYWNKAVEVYDSSMRIYSEKYAVVAKFVKKAKHQMQHPDKHFVAQKEDEYSFWIALERKQGHNIGQVDELELDAAVVGVVGLRGLAPVSSSPESTSLESEHEKVLELCHMAVEQTQRGKGIGAALLKAALSFAKESISPPSSSCGERTVSWRVDLTVLNHLETAHRLYLKAGFINVGDPIRLSSNGGVTKLQRMTFHGGIQPEEYPYHQA